MTVRSAKASGLPPATLTPMGTLLFSASEPGAWYDPSDLSTLFQDSAGATPVTAVEQPVGRILDKSGRGNHATQSTTTKRPVLSRRVNLLTRTEQFDDAAWVKSSGGVVLLVPNAATSPIGTGNATKLIAHTNSAIQAVYVNGINGAPAKTAKIFAKKAEYKYVRIFSGGGDVVVFDLDSGEKVSQSGTSIVNTSSQYFGDGWWLLSATLTRPDNAYLGFGPGTSASAYQFAGDGVSGIYIWGASLTLATDAHLPYQRVNTATDYDADPAKFPAYRRLDGVDDSHASATGGGGTAGFYFSSAVSPQGGAGTARTLFSDAGTNTGYIVRLNASNQLELAAGNGTEYTTVATSGTLAVGTTDVVQAWDDGANLNVKIGNGATASVARPTVSAGTAGYTMGQDNGASTGYFNGRVYSTIYRKDSGLTQVQREAVALYQRQKARMP